MLKIISLIGLVLLTAIVASARTPSLGDQVQRPVEQAVDLYQKTQRQEEHWREEKQALTAEYEALVKLEKALSERKKTLQDHNRSAGERIAAKERKIDHMRQVTTQIDPFLGELVERLDEMTATDAPFLYVERRERLDRLHSILKDPEISVSEKFRKVSETLFVEAEYGQTIEVYQDTISLEGDERLVDILRLGRLSLFYQSLDQASCGHYDVERKKWQPLPAKYNRQIQAAIEMGAKRRPIELLSLPIGRIAAP